MMELFSLGQYRIEADLDALWAAPGLRLNRCRAVDTVRKRPALLNLLEIDPSLDARLAPRLLEQAQAAADLVHPHLGWVWETGQIEGRQYIAERLAQGQTLAYRLAERGPLGWDEAQKAVAQIAQGLDFAHARGWVHGALSPAQVWLSPEVGAVVTGWGMQRGLRSVHLDAPALVGRTAPDHPAAQALLPYLSPEALLSGQSGPPGDQYVLACLWYEMLTGQPAFPAASPEELLVRQSEGLRFPGLWPEGTPWELETVLERATAETPAGRYLTAGELAAAPQKLADEPGFSAEERARRAEQARQRREAAEQARRQAEETTRLAALEQARREIEDRVRRAAQPLSASEPEAGEAAAAETPPPAPPEEPAARPLVEGAETLPGQPPDADHLSQPVVMAVGAAGPGVAAHHAARGLGAGRKPAVQADVAAMDEAAAIAPLASPAAAESAAEPAAVRPEPGPAERPPVWLVWAGLILAAALLLGLWWSGRPGAAGPTATFTATAVVSSPTPPSAATATPRPGGSPTARPLLTQAAPLEGAAPLTVTVTLTAAHAPQTVVATPTFTVTRTVTSTATWTMTPTDAPTATPTQTPVPSQTGAPSSPTAQTRAPQPTITPHPLPTKDPEDTRHNNGPTRRP